MTSTTPPDINNYSEWLNSLSPEDRKKYRDCENARIRKFYQENLAPKVSCPICNKEVSMGWLPKHQESRSCKPPTKNGDVVRARTDNEDEYRAYHKEYAKQWRERKRQAEQSSTTQLENI